MIHSLKCILEIGSMVWFFFLFFKIDFIYLRGEGETEDYNHRRVRETFISWLLFASPPGTEPQTEPCAPTRNPSLGQRAPNWATKSGLLFIYLSITLNPWGIQHYMDFVFNDLSRKVFQNFSQIVPLFPWAWVIFPQMTLLLSGLPPGVTVLFFALYTEAHLLPSYNSVSSQA